jgi:hypothetical protein
MRKINNSLIALPGLISIIVLVATFGASAQVVLPVEIKDAQLRALQQQYNDDLKTLGVDVLSIPTEYSFYLSRRLDLDEQQQKRADQRSIRFDRYKGRTVLEITGNYYAAYSAEKMSPEQRAKATFDAIVLPILRVEVPRFQSNPDVQGYAFEVSHHILGKVMDVPIEHPENFVAVLPQEAAIRLIGAKDDNIRQAALLKSELYLNAQPVTIWLDGHGPQLADQTRLADPDPATPVAAPSVEVVRNNPATDDVTRQTREQATVAALGLPNANPLQPIHPPSTPRDISPQALASLQAANSAMVSAAQGGSRYRLAALAFDDHIAHLIRPVLGYIKDDSQFDGIGFSTNIHVVAKSAATASSIAVEFFFPFPALRCYESYDCTGQQLVDAGTVLINGERAALGLQAAETTSGP